MRYLKILYIAIILLALYSFSQENMNSIKVDSTLINKVDSLNEASINLIHSSSSKAIILSKKAMEIAKDINYKKGEAISLNYMGKIYYNMSEYSIAHDYQIKALEIHKEIGYKIGIAISLESLGVIYSAIDKHDDALKSFNESLNIYAELNKQTAIASAHGNIAITYKEQALYDKAIEHYKISLDIYTKENNKFNIARTLYNIGNLYYDEKKYDKALSYTQDALSTFEKIDNRFGIILSYIGLGRIYKEKKEFNLAEDYLVKALKMSSKIDSFSKYEYLHKTLYQFYYAKNDYKNALKHYTLYQEQHEKSISEKNLEQINFAKEKYQTELIDKENEVLINKQILDEKLIQQQKILIAIILLSACIISISLFLRYRIKKKANIILEKQKEDLSILVKQLNILNKEKDGFMSILSHDLKNPFNVIIGLLDLLNNQYDELDKDEIKEYILHAANASNSAFTLLEDILTWSRTQSKGISVNPEEIKLYKLCDKSIEVLIPMAQKKNISIENLINKNIILKVDAFTLSTIISNITSNAIKFTKEGGHINISSEQENENILIKIKDDGVGMTQAKIDELFQLNKNMSTEGTNQEKGTGLGLLICYEFAKLNNASINVESEEGKGTTFIIGLPN